MAEQANFEHFNDNGVDYLKIFIECPVCLEHGWPTEASYWYHDKQSNGTDCGGEMYLGDNGYYYCKKCGHTSPALQWRYRCQNHQKYGSEEYLSITDGKWIASALSVTGQLSTGPGLKWLIRVSENLLKQMGE